MRAGKLCVNECERKGAGMNYKPVMTGISRLDKILGGLRPGTLNVISGRPGMGKTSLALSIAIKAAKNRDKAVLYYSLEAARTEIVRKLLVSELLYDHESGNCESIKTILNGFENLPIYVDDCLNLTPDLLYEKYDALLADNVDIGLVIVDYLQLFSYSKNCPELVPASFLEKNMLSIAEITEAASVHALKMLALKHKIPVVVLSHCTKKADYRKNHIPELEDIRCELLRQEADSVMFLVSPVGCYDDLRSRDDSILFVAKNRFGESGMAVNIKWDKRSESFVDNPGKFSFDYFNENASNRFALWTAILVAQYPGDKMRNPFFIYGKSGHGKTHLLKAIGNYIMEKYPEKKVVYITSEAYTNEFIDCIVKKKYADFREHYRTADVLLFDDAQYLFGKAGVQTEFYNTFQTLIDNGKQIVITCDRNPKELGIGSVLVSLFQSGVLIEI